MEPSSAIWLQIETKHYYYPNVMNCSDEAGKPCDLYVDMISFILCSIYRMEIHVTMKLNFIYCLMLSIKLIVILNRTEFHWGIYCHFATSISQLRTCPY